MGAMHSRALRCFVALVSGTLCAGTFAQSGEKPDGAALETLIKKIDEQNMKIDLLSQQILKLEQQVSSMRPGVIIGEATPTPAPSGSGGGTTPTASAASTPASGNAHVVAKGETLISIAKAHKVSVDDLQKHNNIEDARKLQAGQTIMIPTPGASPSPSPSASP